MKETRFINPRLDLEAIARDVRHRIEHEQEDGITVPVLNGAIVINDFLKPEGRQILEGQAYSQGSDLSKAYRTSRPGYGDHELYVVNAEEQIPIFSEFRREVDAFLERIFERPVKEHMFQLRELAPVSRGHARHRDYERGFDIIRAEEEYALTTVSLSFPISWNDGKSMKFRLETTEGEVIQDRPGSLALFGPKIYHGHPETSGFGKPSLWLVTLAFFKVPRTQAVASA